KAPQCLQSGVIFVRARVATSEAVLLSLREAQGAFRCARECPHRSTAGIPRPRGRPGLLRSAGQARKEKNHRIGRGNRSFRVGSSLSQGISHKKAQKAQKSQKILCLLCLFVANSVHINRNRTSLFAGSMVSICTLIVSPGPALLMPDTFARR